MKKKSEMKSGPHLVVVSDLHVGCQLGLCPPAGAAISEGGYYKPSPLQKKVAKMWRYFWYNYVPRITKGDDFDVVVNGECIDGVHHNSVTQWSHDLADQAAAALGVLRPIKKLCKGKFYVIRGTEAHSGQSGQWDEWIARELGAVPTKSGQYSRYELWKMVGRGLVHLTHHIGGTSSSAYEFTAVGKELVEAYVEGGRWGDRPPDVIVRSHRHRHMCVEHATGRGKATSVVTPGWQGKTPFAHKIAGARQSQPMFGGIVISWSNKEKFLYERHQVWRLERDPPE
jgi:hypothetical protein